MATMKPTRWSNLILRVGDGASPEVFAPMCSINAARSLSFTSSLTEEAIPDCDDLEKIMWMVREKVSVGVDASGAGKVDRANVKTFVDWSLSKDAVNCQLVLHDSDPANVITFEGAFHLETFSMNGDPGTPSVEGDIALKSTGEIVPTYGANVGGS